MYVRMVKPAPWAQLQERGAEAVAAAAQELTQRGTQVSVYECDSRGDVELVAVALSATRPRRQPLHYIEIPAEGADAAGVPRARSDGETPLPDANRLHWDLDLSGERAQRLVATLAERGVALRTFAPSELAISARRLRDAGQPIPAGSWLLR